MSRGDNWIFSRDAPYFNGRGSDTNSPIPTMKSPVLDDGTKHPQSATTSYTATVNGMYGYERSAQSPVSNFCRFPPSLVDTTLNEYDELHDLTLNQQVSNINNYTTYIL